LTSGDRYVRANVDGRFRLDSAGDLGLGFKSVTVRRYAWSNNKLASVTERHGCCT